MTVFCSSNQLKMEENGGKPMWLATLGLNTALALKIVEIVCASLASSWRSNEQQTISLDQMRRADDMYQTQGQPACFDCELGRLVGTILGDMFGLPQQGPFAMLAGIRWMLVRDAAWLARIQGGNAS
jgi:hypothetical protein